MTGSATIPLTEDEANVTIVVTASSKPAGIQLPGAAQTVLTSAFTVGALSMARTAR